MTYLRVLVGTFFLLAVIGAVVLLLVYHAIRRTL